MLLFVCYIQSMLQWRVPVCHLLVELVSGGVFTPAKAISHVLQQLLIHQIFIAHNGWHCWNHQDYRGLRHDKAYVLAEITEKYTTNKQSVGQLGESTREEIKQVMGTRTAACVWVGGQRREKGQSLLFNIGWSKKASDKVALGWPEEVWERACRILGD